MKNFFKKFAKEKSKTQALKLQDEISGLLSNGEILIPGMLSFQLMEEGLKMVDMQASPNGTHFTTRYVCLDGSIFGVVHTQNKVIMVKECHPNKDVGMSNDDLKILNYVLNLNKK